MSAERIGRRLRTAGLSILGVGSIAFLFVPVLTVLAYSFNTSNFLVYWRGFGTRWFSAALSNPDILSALRVSIEVAFTATLASLVIGTAAGYAMVRAPRWISVALAAMLLGALTIPEIVLAVGDVLWFAKIGLGSGISAMIVGHSIFGSALVGFVVRARMVNADRSLEEAATDLGATSLVVMRTVLLPYLAPALASGALLAFTLSLDDVIVSEFVSSPLSTPLPVYIFGSTRAGIRGDIAAMAAIMFAVTLVGVGLALLVARRFSGRRSTNLLLVTGQAG